MATKKSGKKKFAILTSFLIAFSLLLMATSCNSSYTQDAEQDLSSLLDETLNDGYDYIENTEVNDTYSEEPDSYSDYDTINQDYLPESYYNQYDSLPESYYDQYDPLPFEPISITEDMRSTIDNIAALHGAVGVQVVIIQNGEIIGTHEFGYATRNSAPMTPDTKIRVASLTKPILAMLAVRLHEEGKIDIDADIGEIWDMDIRNPYHPDIPITIRHLMTHTSSIYAFGFPFQSSETAHRSQFRSGNLFTERQPGVIESWHYNDFVYCLLGVTLEIATNETVNNLANRFFFEPLGIDAAFGAGSISDTDNLATLYRSNGNVARSVNESRDILGSTYPGQTGLQFTGGLVISASDYAMLIAALIGNGELNGVRILSPESIVLLHSSQGTILGTEMQGITSQFEHTLAFRWWTDELGQEELIWHTGGAFGVAALTSFNPITGNGVIVVTTGADLERRDNYIHIICAEIAEYLFGYL